MTSQKNRILERLKQGTWLSVIEATKEMYIFRLGARIYDLRANGHHIIERKVPGKNYSEYKLVPPEVPLLPSAFNPPKQKVDNQAELFA